MAVFNTKEQNVNSNVWCVDSGATSHMCVDKSLFTNMKQHAEKVELAGKYSVNAQGIGEVNVDCGKYKFSLTNCLYVPDLSMNFVSVPRADERGFKTTFEEGCATITDKTNGMVMLKAKKADNLYLLNEKTQQCCLTREENAVKWHNRFGHINFQSLCGLANKQIVHGVDPISNAKDIVCVSCLKSKITTQPFTSSESRAENIGELIHSDVCGPFQTKSHGSSRYFLTFIDDKSRRIFVYFLRTKDQVFATFKSFKKMIELQSGNKIKTLRTDNGGEYVNRAFDDFLEDCGIRRQLTVPYTPQQNGVAERANRTLVEMARCMLVHAGLAESYWGEAINCAAYIRNRTPTKALDDVTPYEVWTGKKPVVKHFKVFGCLAIALDKTEKNKLRQKGKEYVMIGYDSESKAYRLYDPEKRQTVVRRDVKFDEDVMMGANSNREVPTVQLVNFKMPVDEPQAISNDDDEAESDSEDSYASIADEANNEIQENDENIRTLRSGNRYNMVSMAYSHEIEIPVTVEAAMNSAQSQEWWRAMQEEYHSLLQNDTWEPAELPKNHKTIGCKWVFAVKRDVDGNIERYKARLVAKGCSQTYCVDYREIFSPVV